ncbi:hypothetical protein [Nostoc sp. 'Peltigera membranacea cyanobiont' 210A]|nr:hypothetical protein [Nostoc sp. 'Peltigera membranacea cyanobiont' 210A]
MIELGELSDTELGLGIGDWVLGIGDWGLGIGYGSSPCLPSPQSPVPSP